MVLLGLRALKLIVQGATTPRPPPGENRSRRRTYALSSALLAGVGNDAAFIADHIAERQ